MASIIRDPNGRKRISFVHPDGGRKVIRLGKMPLADARMVKSKIESLLASRTSGQPLDGETSKWVREIPGALAGKLAKVGLIADRHTQKVGGLITAFLNGHPQTKPGTVVVLKQIARDLRKHFGEECRLQTIGRPEAEAFRQRLIDRKLAAATICRRLQHAKQFFSLAVRNEWIEKNPFEGVTHRNGNPRERQHYITAEDTQRLIDAAPNWEWRTIIALCRYGGLRCPSEILSLRLADLDWKRGAMRVISPKTECHGQGSRVVPMFARLRPQLEEAWEMAKEGQTHVIPEDLYLPAANGPRGWVSHKPRATFLTIIDRAGLELWPRPFHNLRASCESDLAREYPITTVCKWIGNTVAIAAKHYIQVTDSDFQRAVGADKGAARQAAQSVHEMGCNSLHGKTKNPMKPEVYAGVQGLTFGQKGIA